MATSKKSLSSSIVQTNNRQPPQTRDTKIVTTLTTIDQQCTEHEIAPFFVKLSTLPKSQLHHLRSVGLLIEEEPETEPTEDTKQNNNNNDDDVIIELNTANDTVTILSDNSNNEMDVSKVEIIDLDMLQPLEEPTNHTATTTNNDDNDEDENTSLYDICLLRTKHIEYVQQIWMEDEPLRPSFISLDASRPWMIYWCLHSCDLVIGNDNNQDISSITSSEQRQAIIRTLWKCFTKQSLTLPSDIVENDTYLQSFPTKVKDGNIYTFTNVGGFGGNFHQLAHAATTYAAVSALCILAPYESAALEVLEQVKLCIYPWLVSLLLPQNNGSYRMHHDGEIDVRASYCVLTVASLLGFYSSIDTTTTTTITNQRSVLFDDNVAQYITQCQSWEGGFSGEPFAEAHGGYTFCAIAAIQIWLFHQKKQNTNTTVEQLFDGNQSLLDVSALTGWLVRRQTSYEGGFNGRSNKLVDGCYSYWQGSGTTIVSYWEYCMSQQLNTNIAISVTNDPWIQSNSKQQQSSSQSNESTNIPPQFDTVLYDIGMLQRYILLCAQDVNGGLRDKPSKSRDFYHTCYNLSGLSVSQYGAGCDTATNSRTPTIEFGHEQHSVVRATHPCYNIQIDKVQYIQNYWATTSSNQK